MYFTNDKITLSFIPAVPRAAGPPVFLGSLPVVPQPLHPDPSYGIDLADTVASRMALHSYKVRILL